MPAPFARSVRLALVPVAAVPAVAGALVLGATGLILVLVTAAIVGGGAAAMVREVPGAGRASAADAGIRAGAWAACLLLVLVGTAALAGGATAVLLAVVLAGSALVVRLRRASPSAAPGGRAVPPSSPPAVGPAALQGRPMVLLLPPVGGLDAAALGQEWLRTSAVLTGRLDPVVRRAIVARRAAVLDELERRDPEGFARWLAAGPAPSNPADHVRDLPAAGTDAA